MKKTALLFFPHASETWMGFCVGSGLRGRSRLPRVQPEGTYRRGEVEMWGEVGVEQLYEKICNKSQSNFYFSCAFSVWICWSLLTKCLDAYACHVCWVLANSVLGCVCIDLGAPAVPSPRPRSKTSVGVLSSPPGANQGLPKELTCAQISLPPWAWDPQEPSWLPQLRQTQGKPMPLWLQWWGEAFC